MAKVFLLLSVAILLIDRDRVLCEEPQIDRAKPDTFPNPRVDLERCGRNGVESRICDPHHVLEEDSANKIEEYIKTVQRDTESGCGGFEIGVAIVNRIDPSWPTKVTPRSKATQAFAMALHDHWRVGSAQCQSGILIFISKYDRTIYISTGSGVKHILAKSRIARIIGKTRPHLRRGHFGVAVETAVSAIASELDQDSHSGNLMEMLNRVFGWLVPGSIIFLFFWKATTPDDYNTARLHAQRLDRERALARSSTFNQMSCPICLEDFASKSEHHFLDEDLSPDPVPTPWYPELLVCGHKFCCDCLEEWLARTDTCPICRQKAVRVGSAKGTGTTNNDIEDETKMSSINESPSHFTEEESPNHARPLHRWDQEVSVSGSTSIRTFRPYSDDEWAFRVHSLRRLHPTFVTDIMETRWSDPSYSGTLAEDTDFIQNSTSYPSIQGTGSSGFSSFDGGDFGGGSSIDGGGGGMALGVNIWYLWGAGRLTRILSSCSG